MRVVLDTNILISALGKGWTLGLEMANKIKIPIKYIHADGSVLEGFRVIKEPKRFIK